MQSDRIEVTQADRAAAARMIGLVNYEFNQLEALEMAEAFARHRLAAEARGRAEGLEMAARVAEIHQQERARMAKAAKERKSRQESRDYESMSIEGLHIAAAIRALANPKQDTTA